MPESICAAQHLEILSMDGLRAEKGCKSAVRIPLVSVEIFNTIGVFACVCALVGAMSLSLVVIMNVKVCFDGFTCLSLH